MDSSCGNGIQKFCNTIHSFSAGKRILLRCFRILNNRQKLISGMLRIAKKTGD